MQDAEVQRGECPSSGGYWLDNGRVPLPWEAEARRHTSVEEWFHTLIRQHLC